MDNLAQTGMRSLTSEFSSNDAVLAISANYSTELRKTMCFEGGLEGGYAYQDIAAYSESSNFPGQRANWHKRQARYRQEWCTNLAKI